MKRWLADIAYRVYRLCGGTYCHCAWCGHWTPQFDVSATGAPICQWCWERAELMDTY